MSLFQSKTVTIERDADGSFVLVLDVPDRSVNVITRQVLADLDAGGDGEAAREPTFIGTRRYVRRQRSWFRRDHRIHWLDATATGNADTALRAWRHVS